MHDARYRCGTAKSQHDQALNKRQHHEKQQEDDWANAPGPSAAGSRAGQSSHASRPRSRHDDLWLSVASNSVTRHGESSPQHTKRPAGRELHAHSVGRESQASGSSTDLFTVDQSRASRYPSHSSTHYRPAGSYGTSYWHLPTDVTPDGASYSMLPPPHRAPKRRRDPGEGFFEHTCAGDGYDDFFYCDESPEHGGGFTCQPDSKSFRQKRSREWYDEAVDAGSSSKRPRKGSSKWHGHT